MVHPPAGHAAGRGAHAGALARAPRHRAAGGERSAAVARGCLPAWRLRAAGQRPGWASSAGGRSTSGPIEHRPRRPHAHLPARRAGRQDCDDERGGALPAAPAGLRAPRGRARRLRGPAAERQRVQHAGRRRRVGARAAGGGAPGAGAGRLHHPAHREPLPRLLVQQARGAGGGFGREGGWRLLRGAGCATARGRGGAAGCAGTGRGASA